MPDSKPYVRPPCPPNYAWLVPGTLVSANPNYCGTYTPARVVAGPTDEYARWCVQVQNLSGGPVYWLRCSDCFHPRAP